MLSPELTQKKDQLIAEEHAEEIEQAKRQAAREQLAQIPVPENSMPGLVQQMKLLKEFLGIKESD